ncbi:MAG: hypothetical protein ACOX6E_07870 [Syntrophomonadaceae bacterium]|jgi:hypothetical protein
MQDIPLFQLKFLRTEEHLLLPLITSIKVVQHLYDVLFQYAITPEEENKLQFFIKLMENHIKSKTKAPFSIPLSMLEFMDEGLQELKLLNWMQLKASVFEIVGADSEEEMEKILEFLETICTFNRSESNIIYVYPKGLTTY